MKSTTETGTGGTTTPTICSSCQKPITVDTTTASTQQSESDLLLGARQPAPTGLGGERGGPPQGRWPSNLVHDGSDEVVGAFPQSASGSGKRPAGATAKTFGNVTCGPSGQQFDAYADAGKGSAARFFYSAKASKADRAGSKHPTVKPVALMQWLCRLITPPGGVVLDPFAGSGTTGEACIREGMHPILIEQDPVYVADIQRRLSSLPGPLFTERAA
jgi:site-specific DNA-methyltransferase (adenine-specific)